MDRKAARDTAGPSGVILEEEGDWSKAMEHMLIGSSLSCDLHLNVTSRSLRFRR